jgi:hypothetical protein
MSTSGRRTCSALCLRVTEFLLGRERDRWPLRGIIGRAMPIVGALALVSVEQLYQVIVMFYFGKTDARLDASLKTSYARSRPFVGPTVRQNAVPPELFVKYVSWASSSGFSSHEVMRRREYP